MRHPDPLRKSSVLTRREALACAGIGVCAFASKSSGSHDVESALPIIDCHTHFYDPSRPEGVPWPDKQDKSLYRTVLPDSFKTLAQPLGIVGTVVVEASEWLEDNQWLLDLAARDPYLLGIVGRLDIRSDAFSEQLTRFARNPRYRGIRIQTNDLIRNGAQDSKLIEHCDLLAQHDLELDVNGSNNTPQHVANLASQLPKLRMVINHIGGLRIDGRDPPRAWTEAMENAAKHPNVFCKVSALVEQTAATPAPQDGLYYTPILSTLWKIFGEDRLIFGSNWPVSDRGAPLETVVKIVRDYFMAKGESAAKKFFAENARSAYRW